MTHTDNLSMADKYILLDTLNHLEDSADFTQGELEYFIDLVNADIEKEEDNL